MMTLSALCGAVDKFIEELDQDERFVEAVGIVRENSVGRIWMIGGGIYRPIAANLHGTPLPGVDRDFIVEELKQPYDLPSGWIVGRNRHGNPKFIHEESGKSIDPVPINTIHSIIARGIAPTIENYLSGAPLTVQSIAYDIYCRKIIGNVGLEAIQTKTVGIHNYSEAIYGSERKGMTLREYVQMIADSLGFNAEI